MLEIRVRVTRNRLQLLMADDPVYCRDGSNMACAAAYTLSNTLLIALRTQMGIGTDVFFDNDPTRGLTRIDCGPTEEDMDRALTIYRVAACGLEALAFRHPEIIDFEMTEN